MIILLASAGVVLSAAAELPETVTVGGVFDITGNWSVDGEQGKTAAELAVSDFNGYLDLIGADWRMDITIEDSQALGSVAFEKVQALKSKGIDLLVGMGFSSHIQTSKSYVDSSNMLVISHASQAANLAIDDSIFRLVPPDNNQIPVINAMLKDAGIEALIMVIRDDTWGNGIADGMVDTYEGHMNDQIIKYNTEIQDYSAEASIINDDIKELIEEHGADKVGVLYVGTEEFILLLEQLRPYGDAKQVRWFSTSTQAAKQEIIENRHALEFAEATQLTASRFIEESNSLQQHMTEQFKEIYGNDTNVSTYAYPAYDSIWLLGNALLHTQSTDVELLTAAIPEVARHSFGAAGHLELTEFGDLAGSDYEIWHVSDGQWSKYADYDRLQDNLKK